MIDETLLDSGITRVLSILTEDERRSIPPELIQMATGKGMQSWSPATKHMACKVIKQMIGEDEGMRNHYISKWIEFWTANPEIHF